MTNVCEIKASTEDQLQRAKYWFLRCRDEHDVKVVIVIIVDQLSDYARIDLMRYPNENIQFRYKIKQNYTVQRCITGIYRFAGISLRVTKCCTLYSANGRALKEPSFDGVPTFDDSSVFTADTYLDSLPDKTTVVFVFNHNGNPFRIKITRESRNGSETARAYSGATGKMNLRNQIGTCRITAHTTLYNCIAIEARRLFEIEPTDITFTVTPPAN